MLDLKSLIRRASLFLRNLFHVEGHALKKDSAYWRAKSEEARVIAEVQTDLRSRLMMEGVAQSCDALAEDAAQKEATANARRSARSPS